MGATQATGAAAQVAAPPQARGRAAGAARPAPPETFRDYARLEALPDALTRQERLRAALSPQGPSRISSNPKIKAKRRRHVLRMLRATLAQKPHLQNHIEHDLAYLDHFK